MKFHEWHKCQCVKLNIWLSLCVIKIRYTLLSHKDIFFFTRRFRTHTDYTKCKHRNENKDMDRLHYLKQKYTSHQSSQENGILFQNYTKSQICTGYKMQGIHCLKLFVCDVGLSVHNIDLIRRRQRRMGRGFLPHWSVPYVSRLWRIAHLVKHCMPPAAATPGFTLSAYRYL